MTTLQFPRLSTIPRIEVAFRAEAAQTPVQGAEGRALTQERLRVGRRTALLAGATGLCGLATASIALAVTEITVSPVNPVAYEGLKRRDEALEWKCNGETRPISFN